MKKKTKILGIMITGIALTIGIFASAGVFRNAHIVDEAKAAVQSGWTRVTAVNELLDGGTFILGYEATANSDVIVPLRSDGAAATTSANGLLYSGTTAGSSTSDTIDMASISDTSPYEVLVSASATTSGAINIALASGNFVGNSGSKNTARLYASTSVNADYTPTIGSNDVVTLTSPTSVSTTYTTLQYNTSAPRFSNYNGGQKNVVFYEKGTSALLDSLSVSGSLSKTSYYAGESFDPNGLTITATYVDSTTANVTSKCTFSPNPLTAGTTSVTVSYTEGAVTKTTSVSGITVSVPTYSTVKYELTSKNTFTTSGAAPTGSSASIVETYATSKQMTSGNSQTVTLNGYANIKITKITLSMRSNSSDGAGNFTYAVDGGSSTTLIPTANFNTSGWYGSWSSNYVDVVKNVDIEVSSSIVFVISATVNSLYCQSYSFQWEEIEPKILTGISITANPTKTNYYLGESFDSSGLIVTAAYDNESTKVVTDNCVFTPASLTVDTTAITVSYTENEVTKTATISDISVSNTLQSLEVTANPTKTAYLIGQTFNAAGMVVKALYDNSAFNANYTSYSYSPTAAFDSLGEKTITLTSTENASISTTLTVIVQEMSEGIYTITSNTTTYNGSPTIANLNIAKSDSSLDAITLGELNTFRVGATASGDTSVNTKMLFGGGETVPGSALFNLPAGLIATSVKLSGITRSTDTSSPAPTLSINGVLKYAYNASVTEITTKVYSNSLLIASANARLWVGSIEITAKSETNAALDYGAYFLSTTSDVCVSDGSTNSANLATSWNALESIYSNADLSVRNLVKAADADEGGNDLEKAIARYTYIAQKYDYEDFMGLGIVAGANQFHASNDFRNNIMIIVVVSLIGISVLVSYRIVYKRKKD